MGQRGAIRHDGTLSYSRSILRAVGLNRQRIRHRPKKQERAGIQAAGLGILMAPHSCHRFDPIEVTTVRLKVE